MDLIVGSALLPVNVLVQGMPYTRSSFLRAFLVERQGCDLAQGLVWPKGVVNVFPFAEELVDLGEGGGGSKPVVELLFVGALGPFDMSVQFRGAWRQDEESNATLTAGVLELSHELGAAVHLDGSDG